MLWHHINRRPTLTNIPATRFRLQRAGRQTPLHLSFELLRHDNLTLFAPLFQERQDQWQKIDIHGCSVSHLEIMFSGMRLPALETLRLFPGEDETVNSGDHLSSIYPPNLRYFRAHIIQLHLVSTPALLRLHVDCCLPRGHLPRALADILAFRSLTHLQLSDIDRYIVPPESLHTMPHLAVLVLLNVHADRVRPLLEKIHAPMLHTLSISLIAHSRLLDFQYSAHSQPISCPALSLVHLNQAPQALYPHVGLKMVFSLGWAYPYVKTLQTNIHWSSLSRVLNPTPADMHFAVPTELPLPIPFPQISTLAIRDGSMRSLNSLEQLLSIRGQTQYPILQCGVESHLVHAIAAPVGTKVIAWDRDVDSHGVPLFPILN